MSESVETIVEQSSEEVVVCQSRRVSAAMAEVISELSQLRSQIEDCQVFVDSDVSESVEKILRETAVLRDTIRRINEEMCLEQLRQSVLMGTRSSGL